MLGPSEPERRHVGANGARIPAIGFGTWDKQLLDSPARRAIQLTRERSYRSPTNFSQYEKQSRNSDILTKTPDVLKKI